MKKINLRATPDQISRMKKCMWGSMSATAEKAFRAYPLIRQAAIESLRGVFTRNELVAILDRHNGFLIDDTFQINPDIFRIGMEDAEQYESTLTRHGADPVAFFEKLESIDPIQIFFLTEEALRTWEVNRSTEEFVSMFS